MTGMDYIPTRGECEELRAMLTEAATQLAERDLRLATLIARRAVVCPECKGLRQVITMHLGDGYSYTVPHPCPTCGGTGGVWEAGR
jgi:hypothetical protein